MLLVTLTQKLSACLSQPDALDTVAVATCYTYHLVFLGYADNPLDYADTYAVSDIRHLSAAYLLAVLEPVTE